MRFRLRAALLAVLVAAAAAGCNGRTGVLGQQYEYEEDLTLRLDGSATLVVNASIPALVALRGFSLDTSPRARVDLLAPRVRELYQSQYAEVIRVAQWTRSGRRFVGVRLRIPDVRALPKAAPFSWSNYELRQQGDQTVFRHTLGAPARDGEPANVGWTGDEIVAFRLHLPSRIQYQNTRTLDTNQPRSAARGNILTWEQRLTDRLDGKPVAWEQGVPGVMAVRMDSQSILYRTLYLFAIAFLAAIAVLALLIWWTMRKGRET
jgi:hypothetical protein